jgi:hypothetical protein
VLRKRQSSSHPSFKSSLTHRTVPGQAKPIHTRPPPAVIAVGFREADGADGKGTWLETSAQLSRFGGSATPEVAGGCTELSSPSDPAGFMGSSPT